MDEKKQKFLAKLKCTFDDCNAGVVKNGRCAEHDEPSFENNRPREIGTVRVCIEPDCILNITFPYIYCDKHMNGFK